MTDAGASISRWPTELPAWPHARGAPPDARGIIRSTPEDFFVEEQLAVDFSGDGEHVWLHIEKTGVTTLQVCERIADCFQARPRDVGFSGLKDRWAVTRQWFSVPLAVQQDPAPLADTLALPELRVLNCRRHFRKLRRGTHRANRFELVVREVQGDCAAVDADLARIRDEGVPNYFGEQRFSGGSNLALADALFAGRRMKRNKRSFALSAARSYLFNSLLAARVTRGDWNALLPGECVMLDGSGSHFSIDADIPPDAVLQSRLRAFDIHPSGPLPGQGESGVSGAAAEIEQAVLAEHQDWLDGLVRLRVDAGRRALRLRPAALSWTWSEEGDLRLTFELPPGAYATVILRECLAAYAP